DLVGVIAHVGYLVRGAVTEAVAFAALFVAPHCHLATERVILIMAPGKQVFVRISLFDLRHPVERVVLHSRRIDSAENVLPLGHVPGGVVGIVKHWIPAAVVNMRQLPALGVIIPDKKPSWKV